MANLERFSNNLLCQTGNQSPVELTSGPGEVNCLAYNLDRKQLCALHVLPNSGHWTLQEKQSFQERILLARSFPKPGLPRILGSGGHEGLVFYRTVLEDGEDVPAYLARTGAIPAWSALQLVSQLILTLEELEQFPRLFRRTSLANLLIVKAATPHDPAIFLQITELGLSSPEKRSAKLTEEVLCKELGELIYFFLTGCDPRSGLGPAPEVMAICQKAPRLCAFLNTALGFSESPTDLDRARAAVLEGISITSPDSQPLPHPQSQWTKLVFGGPLVAENFPKQFALKPSAQDWPHQLSMEAHDLDRGCDVLLHVFPPDRVIPHNELRPVPPGLSEVAEEDPHLLFPYSTWASRDFTFVVENKAGAFNLYDLIRARHPLSATDALTILEKLLKALDAARRKDLTLPSLHPQEAWIAFSDKSTTASLAELAVLPLCDWPEFSVALPLHLTALSLCDPLSELRGAAKSAPEKDRIPHAFFMVALELCGGPDRFRDGAKPASLIDYLDQVLLSLRRGLTAPEPWAVVKAFELHCTTPIFARLAAAFGLPSQTVTSSFAQDAAESVQVPAEPSPSVVSQSSPLPADENLIKAVVHISPPANHQETPTSLTPEPRHSPIPPSSIPAAPNAIRADESSPPTRSETPEPPSDLEQLDANSPVPTLRVDLARLTTSDSLFSRKIKQATIRNN